MKTKVAGLWTLFNGLELAGQSIRWHASFFDELVIGWQRISNRGHHSQEIEGWVHKEAPPGSHLVEFTPDFLVNTKENERRKLQMMIDFAREKGCTHFLLMACDHFYTLEEFWRARNAVIRGRFMTSFTRMFTYYKRPTWRLSPPEDYFCPFISAITPETRVINRRQYPAFVDPSIKIEPCEPAKLFEPSEIMLHHFSMVRKDVDEKLRNAAAGIRWSPVQTKTFAREFAEAGPGSSLSYFGGRKIIEVRDPFTISI